MAVERPVQPTLVTEHDTMRFTQVDVTLKAGSGVCQMVDAASPPRPAAPPQPTSREHQKEEERGVKEDEGNKFVTVVA
uniref:Uncharacterized protein n=1 Tax=Oryza sativa subsp. japonica TaxID=39947 RepID=Q8H3Y6_ORYSJ|nr:hypothetical protein [Oryza sativa Japonica Group]